MYRLIDFVDGRLMKQLPSTDSTMWADSGIAKQLNQLNIGDHTYLILKIRDRREIVKYTHTRVLKPAGAAIDLPIARGQFGTTATTFPYGSCIYSQLTSGQLEEWFRQKNCNCGDTP